MTAPFAIDPETAALLGVSPEVLQAMQRKGFPYSPPAPSRRDATGFRPRRELPRLPNTASVGIPVGTPLTPEQIAAEKIKAVRNAPVELLKEFSGYGAGKRLAASVAGAIRGEGPVSKLAIAEAGLAALPIGPAAKTGAKAGRRLILRHHSLRDDLKFADPRYMGKGTVLRGEERLRPNRPNAIHYYLGRTPAEMPFRDVPAYYTSIPEEKLVDLAKPTPEVEKLLKGAKTPDEIERRLFSKGYFFHNSDIAPGIVKGGQRMPLSKSRKGLGEQGTIGVGDIRPGGEFFIPSVLRDLPGTAITRKGFEVDVQRFQKAEQAGEITARTGVHYLPKGRVTEAAFFKKGGDPYIPYGGSQEIAGRTAFKRPLVIEGVGGGGEGASVALKQMLHPQDFSDLLSAVRGFEARSTGDAADKARRLLTNYGGDPELADEIARHSFVPLTLAQRRGLRRLGLLPDKAVSFSNNRFRFFIQENIAATQARRRGHDGIISLSRAAYGRPKRISEIFDLREAAYPVPGEKGVVHPEFKHQLRPDRGRAASALLPGMAGAISGGATGAALDEDQPLRGAVAGTVAGGLAGGALGSAVERLGASRSPRIIRKVREGIFDKMPLRGSQEALERANLERELPYGVAQARDAALRREQPFRRVGEAFKQKTLQGLSTEDRGLLGLNERGGLGGGISPEDAKPGDVIASGLHKDIAIEQVKKLKAAGIRAEMRRTGATTFSVVKRGEPQLPVKKEQLELPKKKELPAKRPPSASLFGNAGESGLQSRTMAALHKWEYKDRHMTASEWLDELAKDPDASKREIEALRGKVRPEVWDMNKREFVPSKEGSLSVGEMKEFVEDNSPVGRLEVEVRAGEGRELTERELEAEAENIWEGEQEYLGEEAGRSLSNSLRSLRDMESKLVPVFGVEGAKRTRLAVEQAAHKPLHDLFEDAEGMLFKFDELDNKETIEALDRGVFNAVKDAAFAELDRLASVRQGQFILPGTRPENKLAYTRARGALKAYFDELDFALEKFEAKHGEPDWDWLNERARESLDEAGVGSGFQATEGNPEYQTYQRSEPDAPYREILIKDPQGTLSGAPGGHFGRKVISHARAEIDDKNLHIIEVQSDARPDFLEDEWKPLGSRVQLSVAASLHRAASEGLSGVTWADAADAASRGHLRKKMAELIYENEIPKAFKRILKHLNATENFIESATRNPRIKLTPELRKRILEVGVPAMAAVGAVGFGKKPTDSLSAEDKQLLGIPF